MEEVKNTKHANNANKRHNGSWSYGKCKQNKIGRLCLSAHSSSFLKNLFTTNKSHFIQKKRTINVFTIN